MILYSLIRLISRYSMLDSYLILVLTGHFNVPNPLSSWLYNSQPQIVRDLTKLHITFGQYESYYASDGSSSSWANLPPTLEKALESRRMEHSPWKPGEEPIFVSLGAEGRYFMRTANGGGGWELKGKAEGINKYLTDAPNFSDIAVRSPHSCTLRILFFFSHLLILSRVSGFFNPIRTHTS